MVQASPGLHENFCRDEPTRGSSDRAFGLVFTVVFALVGGIKLYNGSARSWWWLAAAGVILSIAVIRPSLLAPVNRLWFRFGMLLHRIVNPIVMGFLFYACVVPTGFLVRLFGGDPLRLKTDPEAATYWIERRPPGPVPDSLKNQF